MLVIHTFSKSRSLAGMRVGYAMGHPDRISGLERVKNSFNCYPLDKVSLAGAVAAIDDQAYFERSRSEIIATRDELTHALECLGFDVLPSMANFVFIRHPARNAVEMVSGLRAKGILVRHFRLPRTEQFLMSWSWWTPTKASNMTPPTWRSIPTARRRPWSTVR